LGAEGLLDGANDCILNAKSVVKPHLTLRWMNINVNGCGLRFDEKESNRILPFHQGGVIAFPQGTGDDGGFDRATIEEAKLLATIAPAHPGRADKPPNPDIFVLMRCYLKKTASEINAYEATDSFAKIACRGQLERKAVVTNQRKTDVLVSDRLRFDHLFDVGELGVFGSEKFAAGRKIIKERTGFNLGSGRFSTIFDTDHFSTVDRDFGACQ
jgi:hypothetical protein